MQRPCTYVGRDTAKNKCSKFYGVFKRKKYIERIFDKYSNLKYKFGKREFWCIGYYVDTVGKNKRIYKKSVTRRYSIRPNKFTRIYRSIHRRESRKEKEEMVATSK